MTIQDFDLAMNGSGTAVVALGRGSGRVDLLQRPPRGPWSGPERVAAAGPLVSDVLVALNDAEDVFVGWGAYGLFGKCRPQGGDWSERSTISPETDVEVLEETFAEVAPGSVAGSPCQLWTSGCRPNRPNCMLSDPAATRA